MGSLQTCEAGDVIRVRARRVDYQAAAHFTPVRVHPDDAAVASADARDRHPRLEADTHTPAVALVRLRHGEGRYVPVGGRERRLEGADVEQQPEPRGLGAANEDDLEAGLHADGL